MQDHFQITTNSVTITVERLVLPGYVAFRAVFSSSRLPLVLARATDFSNGRFWTSIPEGRQKEAEGVGKLIEDHLKKTN